MVRKLEARPFSLDLPSHSAPRRCKHVPLPRTAARPRHFPPERGLPPSDRRAPAHADRMTLDRTPSVHSFVLRSYSPYSSPRDNALGFKGNS